MARYKNGIIHIDTLEMPGVPGSIGLSACPGSFFVFSSDGDPMEDLPKDLDHIKDWGASGVVTLLEEHEMHRLGLADLAEEVENRDMWWMHLPIRDMKPPPKDFEMLWFSAGPKLHESLRRGDKFVIHCLAGLGRTGTIAAKLMIELGVKPKDAISTIREVRPKSIQTWRQKFYVQRCKPRR